MKEFLDYAENNAGDILGTLNTMVELESFTSDNQGTDALCDYLIQRLREIGAETTVIPQD